MNNSEKYILGACKSGNLKIFKELIDNVSIDLMDKDKNTMLNLAAMHGHVKIFKLLMDRGANPNNENIYGNTPFMNALHSTNADMMDVIEVLLDKVNLNHKNHYGHTALHIAITQGFGYIANQLVLRNIDIDAQDNRGRTALLLAVNAERKDIVEHLVNYGADLEIKNEHGVTALLCAYNDKDIASMLLRNGADIEGRDYDDNTVLLNAVKHLIRSAKYTSNENIEFFINEGANLNAIDRFGNTAMINALDRPDVVKMLIDHGADTTIINHKGFSLYDKSLNIDAIFNLLKDNINDQQDINGNTLLMRACEDKNESAVMRLVDNGADVHQENKTGDSAFKILKRKRKLPDGLQALKEKLILDQIVSDEPYFGCNL